MDRIRFLAVLRGVKSAAAKLGYRGDVLAAADDVPLVGTLRQQREIIAIRLDIGAPLHTTRDRELLARLVRAAVLTSPQSAADAGPPRATQSSEQAARLFAVAGADNGGHDDEAKRIHNRRGAHQRPAAAAGDRGTPDARRIPG